MFAYRPHVDSFCVSDHARLRFLKERNHLLAADRGKAFEEVIDRVAGFEIFDERLREDASPFEDGSAAHDCGLGGNDRAFPREKTRCELDTFVLRQAEYVV